MKIFVKSVPSTFYGIPISWGLGWKIVAWVIMDEKTPSPMLGLIDHKRRK